MTESPVVPESTQMANFTPKYHKITDFTNFNCLEAYTIVNFKPYYSLIKPCKDLSKLFI